MAGTVGPYNAGHRDGRRVTSHRPWLSVCLPHLQITHSRDLGSSFQIPLISLQNTPPHTPSQGMYAFSALSSAADHAGFRGREGGREGGRYKRERQTDARGRGGVKTVVRRLNASFEREVLLFKIPIPCN